MKIRFNPIVDSKLAFFPRRYAEQGIGFYLLSLATCSMFFWGRALPVYIILMGVVSVLIFFLGSNTLGRQWCRLTEKAFLKKVFWTAFVIRLFYAIFIWFLNKYQYGTFYESNAGDIEWYVPIALRSIQDEGGFWPMLLNSLNWSANISDAGYQCYLAFLFWIQGAMTTYVPQGDYMHAAEAFLWLPMILKAVYGASICIFMYRIGQRHFGNNVARMTALFCMLQMNLIWWCGSFMKETEMIFLSCLFADRMDKVLLGLKMSPSYLVGTVIVGLLIYTFRSALFMTAFAATALALVLNKAKTFSVGKKVVAGVLIAAAMAFAVGDTVMQEINETIATAKDAEYQKTNMEWRTNRSEGGNQFAKYAGAAVFAPLIFTIPFPNMVYTNQDQEMLMQVNGGNFEKNVLSFFIIFAMFQLLLSGQWRQHVFPIAYYVGYLAALVLSVFAQSGRFHMPIIPFAMMFGAYGLTLVSSRQHKQWFSYALVVEVMFCVFWSWFKLKGRGII